MQAKLNPQVVLGDSTSLKGKLNFPGFQKIYDFTATGSESSTSATVSSDADKEYRIFTRNMATNGGYIRLQPNGDTGSNYGFQYLRNSSGSITAGRSTSSALLYICLSPVSGHGAVSENILFTPTGLTKTAINLWHESTTGTTVNLIDFFATVWNSTANITSLVFTMDSGNFPAGTRIIVYARRSNV